LNTVYIIDRPGQGLSLHLRHLPEYETEVYISAREFLETTNIARPACVIMDVQLPDMDGTALLERLRTHSDVPVIVTGEQWDMDAVLRMFKLGIFDFCCKPVDPQKLCALVQRALRQDTELLEVRNRVQQARDKLARLTARQRELLVLFAEGRSQKEIASTLAISPRTVEHHRAHLNSQLGTDRLTDFVYLHLLAGGTRALCGVCPNAATHGGMTHGECHCGTEHADLDKAMAS
jgi:two-component system, LuxR family, response regulator FixJ